MAKAVQLKDKDGNKIYSAPYWPIGSIYLSFNSTNPAEFFGGTWERLKGGYLYGCVNSAGQSSETGTSTGASSGSTGGPSTNTSGSTTLTTSQIPSHNHTFIRNNGTSNGIMVDTGATGQWGSSIYQVAGGSYTAQPMAPSIGNTGGGGGHTHTLSSHTHSLNSHTHVVPYIAVFAWRRIA